jgi:hypothetical protein
MSDITPGKYGCIIEYAAMIEPSESGRLLHDLAFRQHVAAASAAHIPDVVVKGSRAKVSVVLMLVRYELMPLSSS